jgi:hypothetical protein
MYRPGLHNKGSLECVIISYLGSIASANGFAAAQNFSYTTCDYPSSDDTTVYPIVNVVGIIVAIVAVALRVTNRVVGARLGLDDYTILLALVLLLELGYG